VTTCWHSAYSIVAGTLKWTYDNAAGNLPCLSCDGTVYLISELTGHNVSQICSFPYVSIVVWLIGNLLFTFVLILMSER
jgi:hypothetical protein